MIDKNQNSFAFKFTKSAKSTLTVLAISTALISNAGTATTTASIDQCQQLAAESVEIVKSEFGLPAAQISISADDICDQIENTANVVSVRDAVRAAMTSFINDSTDIESPGALILDLAFDKAGIRWTTPVPAEVAALAKKLLQEEMNKPQTKIVLLKLDDQPEHGESVSENWILKMKITTLSDHLYWAIVDRAGAKKTYNYGFN